MKIYISLPITDKCQKTQRRKARMWQRYFEAEDHTVINPFDVGDRLADFILKKENRLPTWDEYMFHDLMWLSQCDTIFLCEGWELSKGCLEEVNLANEKGMIFKYEKLDIP